MKTYFKNPTSRAYLMLNSDTNHTVTLSVTNTIKSIVYSEDLVSYTSYLTNSADTTKWEAIDEATFETVKAGIVSSM